MSLRNLDIHSDTLEHLEDEYDLEDELEGRKKEFVQHTGRLDSKRVEDKGERRKIKKERLKRKSKFDMMSTGF